MAVWKWLELKGVSCLNKIGITSAIVYFDIGAILCMYRRQLLEIVKKIREKKIRKTRGDCNWLLCDYFNEFKCLLFKLWRKLMSESIY